MFDLDISDRSLNVRLFCLTFSKNISTTRFINSCCTLRYIFNWDARIYNMCQHERTIATSQRLRGHTPGHEFNKLLVYVHSTDATLPKSGDYVPPKPRKSAKSMPWKHQSWTTRMILYVTCYNEMSHMSKN